jgi:hypothetical protein
MPLAESKNAPANAPVVFRNLRRDFATSFTAFAPEFSFWKGNTAVFFRALPSSFSFCWRFVSSAPRRFSFGFVVIVSRRQAAQHFRRGFKKSLCFWLAHFRYVFTNVMHQVVQHLLDVRCVMPRVVFYRCCLHKCISFLYVCYACRV